ncbi:MAG: hypothetical protein WDN00_10420 [Limisphaerales bacterium]
MERTTNLLAGFNFVVLTNIMAVVPTNTVTDTGLLPASAGFYRIGVEQ